MPFTTPSQKTREEMATPVTRVNWKPVDPVEMGRMLHKFGEQREW